MLKLLLGVTLGNNFVKEQVLHVWISLYQNIFTLLFHRVAVDS